MPLKLWVIPDGPPSWTVRMLADILGLKLEIVEVDFANREHKSPEMLKRNPMGTVPVLQDGDFYISESHTIMIYLLAKYGKQHKERLYPSEARAQALVHQAMYFDTGVMFIKVKLIALPAIFGGEKNISKEVIEQTEENYGILNAYLERTKYAAADHLTIADLSLGSTAFALNNLHKIDATKYPKVVAWLATLEKESYFKNIAIPGAEILRKVIQSFWEKNRKN